MPSPGFFVRVVALLDTATGDPGPKLEGTADAVSAPDQPVLAVVESDFESAGGGPRGGGVPFPGGREPSQKAILGLWDLSRLAN